MRRSVLEWPPSLSPNDEWPLGKKVTVSQCGCKASSAGSRLVQTGFMSNQEPPTILTRIPSRKRPVLSSSSVGADLAISGEESMVRSFQYSMSRVLFRASSLYELRPSSHLGCRPTGMSLEKKDWENGLPGPYSLAASVPYSSSRLGWVVADRKQVNTTKTSSKNLIWIYVLLGHLSSISAVKKEDFSSTRSLLLSSLCTPHQTNQFYPK